MHKNYLVIIGVFLFVASGTFWACATSGISLERAIYLGVYFGGSISASVGILRAAATYRSLATLTGVDPERRAAVRAAVVRRKSVALTVDEDVSARLFAASLRQHSAASVAIGIMAFCAGQVLSLAFDDPSFWVRLMLVTLGSPLFFGFIAVLKGTTRAAKYGKSNGPASARELSPTL